MNLYFLHFERDFDLLVTIADTAFSFANDNVRYLLDKKDKVSLLKYAQKLLPHCIASEVRGSIAALLRFLILQHHAKSLSLDDRVRACDLLSRMTLLYIDKHSVFFNSVLVDDMNWYGCD
jgi:hypothetical protein